MQQNITWGKHFIALWNFHTS